MDKNKLEYWFQHIDKIFKEFRQYSFDYKDKQRRRIFIDNNSKVLFVAHLDTVKSPLIYKQTKDRIFGRGFDDRIGCWIAYKLSKELNADLLLCDNEEKAKSTAVYHDCKDYNWIAEFDRAGTDVVTYDLDSDEFRNALQKYFFIDFGSFSDICSLSTTACCVNIGIGHNDAHSKCAYVDVNKMNKQINTFRDFYKEHKDIAFEQDFRNEVIYMPQYDSYDRMFGDVIRYCDFCGCPGKPIYGYVICEECFNQLVLEYTDMVFD